MSLSRRSFIHLSAVGLISVPVLRVTGNAEVSRKIKLALQPEQRRWFDDQNQMTDLWGFDQPLLRLQQGQMVEIEVENRLSVPSSVHWHGFRLENAMDGVSGVTQEPIAPGERFVYRFTPEDAGSYWAHAHHQSYEQLARGLYMPIIVEEPSPPDVDQDIFLVVDDWRINQQFQIDTESLGAMHDWAHSGRQGNFLTVNREVKPRFEVKAGSRVRLRLLNSANARIFPVALPELPVWILAKDGQPLRSPAEVDKTLWLSPAERYDLIIDIPADQQESLAIQMPADAEMIDIAHLNIEGKVEHPRTQPPAPFKPNPIAELPDREPDHRFVLEMSGGAMGAMREAIYQGQSMTIRELVAQKQVWSFNGVANLSDQPLLEVRSGELVEIEIKNDTRWPHGMHLHGHHFKADSPHYGEGIWHDTLLMDRGETTRIRFVAGPPGSWLLHCHMIEHQAAGMVGWIKVVA